MQRQKQATDLPVGESVLLDLVVMEHPVPKGDRWRLNVQVQGYGRDSGWHKADEKSLLYITPDSTEFGLQAGQRLLVYARLNELSPPRNPQEFDYRSYMAGKGYFTQVYVTVGSCVVVDSAALSSLRMLPLRLQQKVADCYLRAGIEGQELALLLGFTLGDTQLMDDELMDAYSASGLMHILSVSGLHVGLLFALLSMLFFFLNRTSGTRLLKVLLILACLWLYAAVAGFSPSVMRATIMCSFVLLGRLAERKGNLLNSLAASAFFICLLSPQSLFELGFQLSYLAVLSIAAFYPLFSKLLPIQNKLLRGAWQLCAVSFAAQLGTLPLVMLHFHQLPTYFLVANLMVLPLAALLTYLAIAVLLLGWVPLLGGLLGFLLKQCLAFITYIVSSISRLPSATFDGLYLTPLQAAMLLVAVAMLALLLHLRRRGYGWAAISLAVAAALLSVWHSRQVDTQQRLAVLSLSNASYLCLVDGRNAVALRDTASISKRFDYNLKGYFARYAIEPQNLPIGDTASYSSQRVFEFYKGFVWFAGKRIRLLDGSETEVNGTATVEVDYLILTDGCVLPPDVALARYHPRMVIIDSSVRSRRANRWVDTLVARYVACHHVARQGAFVLTMRRH